MEYQVVYCDVLFLINFSMDFLILYITGILRRIPSKTARFLIASGFGAAFDVGITVYDGNDIFNLILTISASAVMCLIAFDHRKNISDYAKTLLVLYFVSFLFGGASFLVIYMLPQLQNTKGVTPSFSLKMLPFILGVVLGLVWLTRRSVQQGEHADVHITFGTQKKKLDCLIDTGNLLAEPISGLPVILCFEQFYQIPNQKLRYIPVQTASGSDLAIGFIPDDLVIQRKGKCLSKKAVIAFPCHQKFDQKRQAQAILPAILLQ